MAYSEKVIEHFEQSKNVGTLDKNDPRLSRLLDEVKEKEAQGYAYEGADASFLLLNAYAERISGAALAGLLSEKLAKRGGRIEWGELALVQDGGDREIGMSFYARWAR